MEKYHENMLHKKGVPMAIYELIDKVLPPMFKKLFRDFFFCISPDITYDLSKRIKSKNYWNPIKYGYLIGVILCFVLTASFCYFENTLFSEQLPVKNRSDVMFFLNDWVNIVMYTIITPLTFGVGWAMLIATFKTWHQLNDILEEKRSSIIDWKGFIVISLILTASSIAVSNYINDVVNIESEIGQTANELHYWFLGDPTNTNFIKPITIYYTIVNFLILVFTLSCVAIFVTAIRPIICLANYISLLKHEVKDSKEKLLERLSAFADVYLFVKILLAIAMTHSILWSWSPLAATVNFNIERAFILFVSVFFIIIPRLHFELEWFKVAFSYKRKGIDIDLKPDYIRGVSYYVIWFLDFFIIGSYFMTVLDIISFGPFGS